MLCSAKALPAGDMPVPNNALKIEWFYMSFHQEDRNRYLESGRRLCDETLTTVAKYLNNIFNSQMADGSLTRSRSSFAQNANSATRCQNDIMTRFAILRTSATDATIAATSVATHIIKHSTRVAPTSASTGTRVTTGATTGTTRLSPSAKTRPSKDSLATSTGRRVIILLTLQKSKKSRQEFLR